MGNSRKHIFIASASCIILIAMFAFVFFQLYVPLAYGRGSEIIYDVQRGMGSKEIAQDLQSKGIIKSALLFKVYTALSGNYKNLKAGKYQLSPSLSIAEVAGKLAKGDILKTKVTFFEGWTAREMAALLEERQLCSQEEFLEQANKDWSQEFDFLKDKPKDVSLEGYLFPDTYQLSIHSEPKDLIEAMLSNFEKKLTPELRAEISAQNKSIFQVVTMASILEKEVRSLEDKKVVAGILWKRVEAGIPLQVDASVNYITGKGHSSARIADTKIDSPYNTYKHYGLPKGPISNPGIESIRAALHPVESPYWYYLSANGSGETIFSSTLDEHNIARYLYL